MNSQSPCLVWNSTTRNFALVSYGLAQAIIGLGNTEGFNRLSRNPGKDFRVVIRQKGKQCSVDIETKEKTYSHLSGRIEAKNLAKQLHRAFGWEVMNEKKDGSLVIYL